jgi:hypothetical protein
MSEQSTLNPEFDGMQEPSGSIIKFGKVGNWFKGVVTANEKQVPNKLKAGGKEMQTIYEFKALGGSYNDIINKIPQEKVTVVVPGEFYSYFAKGFTDSLLKKAKLGQIVGLSFTEERKATQPGYSDTKIIKVFLGGMDPNYQGEQAGDGLSGF